MTQTDSHRYSFEDKPTRRTRDEAREMLKVFLGRLGLDAKARQRISAENERDLLAYTTACHLNISWYDRSRKREQRWYWGFALFTFVLLLATPVAIMGAHSVKSTALTAQIGVIIAGVLSAHRMLSTMFEKRNLVRHFWKAQAELKSLLYSFEDRWRDAMVDASQTTGESVVLKPEFIEDLRGQIQKARQITQGEQEDYFARYDTAFSNLAEILGFAHKQSSEVVSAFHVQRARRAEALAQATTELHELEARKDAIARQLRELERELGALESASGTLEEARKTAVLGAIQSLHGDELDTSFRLSAAQARIAHIEKS